MLLCRQTCLLCFMVNFMVNFVKPCFIYVEYVILYFIEEDYDLCLIKNILARFADVKLTAFY